MTHTAEHSPAAAAATAEGHYVTVVDGNRRGFLLGPYDSHDDAEANVDRAKAEAKAVDPWGHFYAYGTTKVTAPADRLPTGILNARIYLWPCAMCTAGVHHDTCDHTNHVRVGVDFDEETPDTGD